MPSRRLQALLAVLVLAIPLAALAGRQGVLFLATFDDSINDTTPGFEAQVGAFDASEVADVFKVVATPGGDGVLQVTAPANLTEPAYLEGLLAGQFIGSKVEIQLSITPGQENASLAFRAEDDGSTGAIDGEFGGGGAVVINGGNVGFAYQSGIEYLVRLTLSVPLVGLPVWVLEISWDGGRPGPQVFKTSGLLGVLPGTMLKIDRLVIEKPADGTAGTFQVDDLGVFGLEQLDSKN